MLRINWTLNSKFELTDFFKIKLKQKYSVKLNDFEISKISNYPDSNYLDSTVDKWTPMDSREAEHLWALLVCGAYSGISI